MARLCRSLGRSPIDTLTALAIFCLSGQTLMGGEWLIGGVESKVFAHAAGMIAFAHAGERRLRPAVLWGVVAVYLHFLAGGFWLALACCYALLNGVGRKQVLLCGAALLVLLLPLAVLLLREQMLAASAIRPVDMPPSDFIYSILRSPHHVAPFAGKEGGGRRRSGDC